MATIISARSFNQDVSAAKRAADDGPVVITDRGNPAYVLLSISEYRALRTRSSLTSLLQAHDDVDLEPVVSRTPPRAAEL